MHGGGLLDAPLGNGCIVEQGNVKWFNDAKGFGFITRENSPDLFVHHTDIQAEGFRSLTEGQRVEFEVAQGPKGLQAKNVRPV
jgi:CspA family cold shock protein